MNGPEALASSLSSGGLSRHFLALLQKKASGKEEARFILKSRNRREQRASVVTVL